jgi:glyoxylase-like metal-dependent hydrolase (beta-lactamase superfamily II)
LIQEQEAYLLPEVPVTSFGADFSFARHFSAIWTPGHSPGSSCLYWDCQGGILFSGRHLLPNQEGKLVPQRTAKTFHWFRQLDGVAKLRYRFSDETLNYLCPGANTGFLRDKGMIDLAYHHLVELDLNSLRQVLPWE